jgi:hypothetical protein
MPNATGPSPTGPNPTGSSRARDVAGSAKRLSLPLTAVLGGVAYLIAGLVGGQPSFAAIGATVMFAVAAALLVARRHSETVEGLMTRRDERINALDLRATAVTGGVLVAAIIAAFVTEIARGNDGSPYDWLGCLAGVTYLASFVWFRVRG